MRAGIFVIKVTGYRQDGWNSIPGSVVLYSTTVSRQALGYTLSLIQFKVKARGKVVGA